MRKATVLFAVLFVLLIANSLSANAQPTIRIGFVGPYSGPAAYDGTSTLTGGKVAAQLINEAGGILGKKIEILAGDDRGIPSEAVTVVRKLIVQDKIAALDCCWFSSSTLASAPIIDELKIPTTNGVSFRPDLSKQKVRFLFKFAHYPEVEGFFADYWVNILGVKRIAFLARNDDWGRSAVDAFANRLVELGGEVLSKDFYVPGEKDFTSYMTRIKALKPEGITMVDVAVPGATQVKTIKDLGINAHLFGSDGQISEKFVQLSAGAEEGMYVVTRYEPYMDTSKNQRYVKMFKEMRGELPDQYSQPGYDSVYILAEAIKRAGSTDPEKIREELLKTDYMSVSGARIKFNEFQQALPTIYVGKYFKGVRVIMRQIYPYVPYK